VDRDNDMYFIITGINNSNQNIAILYANDGVGNFSEVTDSTFEPIQKVSIAFADVDGDNDLDVLITGDNTAFQRIAKLYTNDGVGNFSEDTSASFVGVSEGSIAFADVDGDNDLDILITGEKASSQPTAILYLNDSIGNFSAVTGTSYEGVFESSLAFGDVDGDNDIDVLIIGKTNPYQPTARLYTNDGDGNLEEVSGTPFEAVYDGSIAFGDVDGDNDLDVLITGKNISNFKTANLYLNDGSGNFTLVSSPFPIVYRSSIAFADVDGDNDLDVLITGELSSASRKTKLYVNDSTGYFSNVSGVPFEKVSQSSIAFADVDGDNDMDLLITGELNSNNPITKLYSNDGSGIFSEVTDIPFYAVYDGSVAFADVDGDNDIDVVITGNDSLDQKTATLYTNDGYGIFSKFISTPFVGVDQSSLSFADVDQDGDMDLLITGEDSSSQIISRLYANDGTGIFSEVTGMPFEEVRFYSLCRYRWG